MNSRAHFAFRSRVRFVCVCVCIVLKRFFGLWQFYLGHSWCRGHHELHEPYSEFELLVFLFVGLVAFSLVVRFDSTFCSMSVCWMLLVTFDFVTCMKSTHKQWLTYAGPMLNSIHWQNKYLYKWQNKCAEKWMLAFFCVCLCCKYEWVADGTYCWFCCYFWCCYFDSFFLFHSWPEIKYLFQWTFKNH